MVGSNELTRVPTPAEMLALEMVISDANKPMLLANQGFLPYL